jgi:hypothetical protein
MMWENVAFTSQNGITIGLKESLAKAAVYFDVIDKEFIGMLPSLFRRLRLNAPVMAAAITGADLGAAGRPMQAEIGK